MNKFLSLTETESSLQISFASQLTDVENVVSRIIQFQEKNNIHINVFGLKLILFEALMNAAKHGNNFNEELAVGVSLEFGELELLITIKDQGSGFDWEEKLKKIEQPANVSGGRGLLLFKAYGYLPTYNERGNELQLCKELVETEEPHL